MRKRVGRPANFPTANQVRGSSPCVARRFNDGATSMQPDSVTLGCPANVAGASWLMLPKYARRATPFGSGQIRKHRAFTLDSSIVLKTAVHPRQPRAVLRSHPLGEVRRSCAAQ